MTWSLVDQNGTEVIAAMEVADSFLTRLRGLQFRKSLQEGHGLLVVPCSSIHTCFMRFAIDVAFLGKDGVVTRVTRNLRPWRIAFAPRGTHATLEVVADSFPAKEGDRLSLPPHEASEDPPRSLQFLSSNTSTSPKDS